MKKIIAAILVLVFALAMSGCVYWDGLSKSEAREFVEKTLEEKYGEEFVVLSIGIRSGQYYKELVAECSPESDKDIVFRIEANHFSENRTLSDEYIRNIVRKQLKNNIESTLEKYYGEYAVEVNVLGLEPFYDSGINSSKGSVVEQFSDSFKKNGDEELNKTNVWIVIDENEQDEIYKLKQALQEMTLYFYSLNIYIDCFFGDQETIKICKEKANSVTTNHFEVMNITYDSNFRRERFIYNNKELVYLASNNDI